MRTLGPPAIASQAGFTWWSTRRGGRSHRPPGPKFQGKVSAGTDGARSTGGARVEPTGAGRQQTGTPARPCPGHALIAWAPRHPVLTPVRDDGFCLLLADLDVVELVVAQPVSAEVLAGIPLQVPVHGLVGGNGRSVDPTHQSCRPVPGIAWFQDNCEEGHGQHLPLGNAAVSLVGHPMVAAEFL